MRKISIFCLSLISMGTAAKAGTAGTEILLSGPIYASPSQNNATCYLFNGSGFLVGTPTIQIIGSSGVMPIAYSSCAAPGVLPGRFCGIAVNPIAPTDAYACKIVVTVPSNVTALQGNMELRSGGTTLQQTPVTIPVE
jgi:hypothetical protein